MQLFRRSGLCLLSIFYSASAGIVHAAGFSLDRAGYAQNERIIAAWSRTDAEPASTTDWIGFYTPDQVPGVATPSLRWAYLSGTDTAPAGPVRSGQITFTSPGLAPGHYVARFLAEDGYAEIAEPVPFTVIFGLDRQEYAEGEGITARWLRAPDTPVTARDWIGIYAPGQNPGPGSPSLLWFYLNGSTTAPSSPVGEGAITFANPPLEPGTYIARFFTNDGYTQLCAGVTFTVTATGGPAAPVFVGSPNPLRDATAGMVYTGCIRGYARDDDPGESLTFARVSGPSWIQVSADGVLSGTPSAGDAGPVELTVSATDLAGNSATGVFRFRVRQPGEGRIESLNVMSYNLFHGWGMFRRGERKGFDTIALSRADIIATCESTNNASGGSGRFQPREVAREFGWYYAGPSGDLGVLSRWPVVATYPVPGGGALGARIRLSEDPLQEVIVYSLHLDWRYYGPYAAAAPGATAADILREEGRSDRERQVIALLNSIRTRLEETATTPVIVAGDFNCPSHQDWTAANAFRHYGHVVDWPVTRRLTDAGLIDSFREVHPDPVAVPGPTWSPLYTEAEPQDRIDFIFYKGEGWRAATSEVFHPVVEVQVTDYNHPLTPAYNNTWPSDHAAVITRFDTASPLETWRLANFGGMASDPGTAGNFADPDRDGLPNLVEYALGLPPLSPSPLPAPVPGNGALTLTWSSPLSATDIQILPEWSGDLAQWQPADSQVEVTGGTDGLRHFRLVLPAAPDGPRFVRLRVSLSGN